MRYIVRCTFAWVSLWTVYSLWMHITHSSSDHHSLNVVVLMIILFSDFELKSRYHKQLKTLCSSEIKRYSWLTRHTVLKGSKMSHRVPTRPRIGRYRFCLYHLEFLVLSLFHTQNNKWLWYSILKHEKWFCKFICNLWNILEICDVLIFHYSGEIIFLIRNS